MVTRSSRLSGQKRVAGAHAGIVNDNVRLLEGGAKKKSFGLGKKHLGLGFGGWGLLFCCLVLVSFGYFWLVLVGVWALSLASDCCACSTSFQPPGPVGSRKDLPAAPKRRSTRQPSPQLRRV